MNRDIASGLSVLRTSLSQTSDMLNTLENLTNNRGDFDSGCCFSSWRTSTSRLLIREP